MRRGFPFFSFFLLGFSFHFSLPLYFSSFFFFLVFFSFRFLVFLLFFLFSIKNVSFVPLMLDSRIQRQLHPFQHLQFDILLFSFPPFFFFFLPLSGPLSSSSTSFSVRFLLVLLFIISCHFFVFFVPSFHPLFFSLSPLFLLFHLFRPVTPHPILQLPLIHFFLSFSPRVFILPLIFNLPSLFT